MLYFRNLRGKEYSKNLVRYKHFVKDALDGNLPTVTFTDPIYGEVIPWLKKWENDGHAQEGWSDFQQTEALLKEMYEALRASPQWENLAWIITFDENGMHSNDLTTGGFPDHVSPPSAPRPDTTASDSGFLYDRIGVRVPTIVVSPWVQRSRVVLAEEGRRTAESPGEFEHSSIGATIFDMLGIQEELSERTKWARRFDFLFRESKNARTDCMETVNLRDDGSDSLLKRDSGELEYLSEKTSRAYLKQVYADENRFVKMFQEQVVAQLNATEHKEIRDNM